MPATPATRTGRITRGMGAAETEEPKSEARAIEVALIEAFEQPVRLVLGHLAGRNCLIDLRSEICDSSSLNGGLHGF